MQSRTRTILICIFVSLVICEFLAAPISAVLIRSNGVTPVTHRYDSLLGQSFHSGLTSGAFRSRTGHALTLTPPDAASLTPSSAIAGGPGFSLTVNGSG